MDIDAAGLALIAKFENAAASRTEHEVFNRVFDDVAWRQLPDGSVRKGGNGCLLIVTADSFVYERPGYRVEVFF